MNAGNWGEWFSDLNASRPSEHVRKTLGESHASTERNTTEIKERIMRRRVIVRAESRPILRRLAAALN